MSEVLLWLAHAAIQSLVLFVLVVIGLQNSAYLCQLLKSIWTRIRVPMGQGQMTELWARQGQASTAVSVIAPAYNEELTITESIRALLSLNYPNFEVVVVNDGSPDSTLQILIDTFGLERISRKQGAALQTKRIVGVYANPLMPNLLVVDKENGRKADAVNAGICFAQHPLLCVIDADSILEPDGLLRVTEPFLTDDGSLIAVGGSIRLTNGCNIYGGKLAKVGMPKGWIPRFQILEYLRAFIVARVAMSQWSMLMLISGAFGVFRKSAVIKAGGYRHDTVGEDLDLVIRLHRVCREASRPCRVAFVPDAICWTEAPETWEGLRNQRSRWQQGAIEAVIEHRRMILNPRYGRIGMIGMPMIIIEDILGPMAELAGYALIPAFVVLGITPPSMLLAFVALSFLFGTALSLGALAHEELQLPRTPLVKDLAILALCAIVENFGYRQANFLFRWRGIRRHFKRDTSWAAVPRVGFGSK